MQIAKCRNFYDNVWSWEFRSLQVYCNVVFRYWWWCTHDVICGKDDGDETGISSVSDNSGNICLMLKITKIGWHIR